MTELEGTPITIGSECNSIWIKVIDSKSASFIYNETPNSMILLEEYITRNSIKSYQYSDPLLTLLRVRDEHEIQYIVYMNSENYHFFCEWVKEGNKQV
jgi:hypothetical protein